MAVVRAGDGPACSETLRRAVAELKKSAPNPAPSAPAPTPPAKTPTTSAPSGSNYKLAEGNCDHLIRKR